MNSNHKTARIVGVLFILSTIVGILNVALVTPILSDPDYLVRVSASRNQVLIATLLDLICAGAFVGVAVMLFPVLKRFNTSTAVGYVVARSFEAVPFIIGAVSLLSLLSLSQAHGQAGAPDAAAFLPVGALLLAVRGWTEVLGSTLIFGLTALILNPLLYRTRLVPRFISVWGLIGAILILAGGLLEPLGFDQRMTLAAPIALQEMVFAVRLIVKGFNPSALASGLRTQN